MVHTIVSHTIGERVFLYAYNPLPTHTGPPLYALGLRRRALRCVPHKRLGRLDVTTVIQYELGYNKNKLGGGYTPTPANIETPPG